jgi:hypothetical protein
MKVNPERVIQVLVTAPKGLSAPEIAKQIRPRVSQPTLWRTLDQLRSEGRVVVEGSARATRYHSPDRGGLSKLRSLRMHEMVANRLIHKPELVNAARDRLRQLRGFNPHGRVYHDRWEQLLDDSSRIGLLRTMTERSESAETLRQESPFSVLVTPEERRKVFEDLRAAA